MFRFQRVRLVTAGAVWLSAFSVYAMVTLLNSPKVIPILVAAVLAPTLPLVFRQGRRLWRNAWVGEV